MINIRPNMSGPFGFNNRLTQLFDQVRHLDGMFGGFKASIPHFGSRPFDSLFQGIGRDYTKNYGQPGFESHLGNSLAYFSRNIIEVRGPASNHRA
jgi:hypothetical protein